MRSATAWRYFWVGSEGAGSSTNVRCTIEPVFWAQGVSLHFTNDQGVGLLQVNYVDVWAQEESANGLISEPQTRRWVCRGVSGPRNRRNHEKLITKGNAELPRPVVMMFSRPVFWGSARGPPL